MVLNPKLSETQLFGKFESVSNNSIVIKKINSSITLLEVNK